MVDDIPPRGTPAYRWWIAGARAEARARDEGRTEAGRQLVEFVDEVTKTDRFGNTGPDLAWVTFSVFALAGAPFLHRLRWAWRVLRGRT